MPGKVISLIIESRSRLYFLRVRREVLDQRTVRASKQFVVHCVYLLVITVCAGMIVGEIYVRRKRIVTNIARRVGITILRVKVMRRADAAKRAQRRTHVVMI